jgi:fumarate reductase (CoM/CoB) subunit A
MVDEVIEADVAVIGGGISALMTAVSACDAGADVVVIDKGIPSKSGGGPVAYSVLAGYTEEPDNADVFFEDLRRSAQYVNNPKVARALADDVADGRVLEMEKYGIIFDRMPNNELRRYKMGGHTYARDLGSFHAATIADILLLEVMRRDIRVFPEIMITKLLTDKGAVTGAVGLALKDSALVLVRAKSIVLGGGGGCQIFGPGLLSAYTTNLIESTGDPAAIAWRSGVQLVDLEFVQFMPCNLVYPERLHGIVVGEPAAHGAILLNSKHEQFMEKYSTEGGRRPTKDFLSQAIMREIKEGRGTEHGGVWEDFTHIPDFRTLEHYPYPFEEMGIDLHKDWLEVAPASHYFMGGVKINENCESNIPGLYALGEAAGGLHGANRMAGCSVASSIVFGRRAGQSAAQRAMRIGWSGIDRKQVHEEEKRLLGLARIDKGLSPVSLKKKIQGVMWDKVGVLRNGQELLSAIAELEHIQNNDVPKMRIRTATRSFNWEWREAIEVGKMLDVAEMVTRAALIRTESRGAHYRDDYPSQDDDHWLKNIVISRSKDGSMELTPVPAADIS